MKKTIRIASLVLAVAAATLGCTAQADQTTDKLKATLQARLGSDAPIKSVSKSPVAGLYEVNLGTQIVYSDASGDYMLLGDLVDTKTRKNLTEARLAETKPTLVPIDLILMAQQRYARRIQFRTMQIPEFDPPQVLQNGCL